MKRFFKSLFELRSILLGVAVINFAFFYAKAVEEQQRCANITCYCFSAQPWFIESFWSYLPLLLSISALGLYFRRYWSLLISFISSAIALCISLTPTLIYIPLAEWFWLMLNDYGFFLQLLLGVVFIINGVFSLFRKLLNKA